MNNKLLYKKILIAIIAVTLAILVMLGSFVFYFDPFFHYHKPYEGVKVLFDNEAYQNAGVARNFDYDSVIVGSSMTKLFRASDFDQTYDCKSVQLTYSGGTIKNFSLILDQVFNHKKEDIRYVFWGLDLFALESGKDQLKQDLPGYLYDDNVFSDVSYLYNKAVYQQIITNIYEGKNLDYDLMWDDENDNTFCQKNAIKDKDINTVFADDGVEPYKFETCSIPEGVIDNVEQNIIPIVEEHKDVKFIFFIPAYSLIYWNSNGYIYGRMPDLISEIDYVYEKLSQYENVEFHMLQLMPETSNLYMYMDSLHNNYQVAKAVPKALKSSQYKVTTDNKEELYGEFYDYVMNSDYKIYTGEKYPFQNEV